MLGYRESPLQSSSWRPAFGLLGRLGAKLCSKTGLATIERFFERHGDQSVLIARLLPFVSFDFVSYFAGLTSMPFKGFMVATGIG